MAMEYYSFEKVLGELHMDEDELKRLVSEGQIRAFRDQNRMKFRQDDISALKKSKQTEPTIILPEGALEGEVEGSDMVESADASGGDEGLVVVEEGETDETLLDFGGLGFDEDSVDEGSVPSVDFDSPEPGGETLTEELVFEEAEDFSPSGGDDAVLDDFGMDDAGTQHIDAGAGDFEDDFGMQTEPLDLHDDGSSDVIDDDDFGMVGGGADVEESFDDGTEMGEDPDQTYVDDGGYDEGFAGDDYAPQGVAPQAGPMGEPVEVKVPVEAPPVSPLWLIALVLVAGLYFVGGATVLDFSQNTAGMAGETVGKFAAENIAGEDWKGLEYAVRDEKVQRPEVLGQQAADAGGGAAGTVGAEGTEGGTE